MRSFWTSALLTISAVLGLTSCAFVNIPPKPIDPGPLLQDQHFPAATIELESPESLFELPEFMKRQLEIQVLPEESEYGRYAKLRQWAFRQFEDYEFTTIETVSLSQLNSARKINCLSFAAMFVAAARYVDVPAEFQLVFAPPYWDISNSSWINNQHINVTGSVQLPPPQYVTQSSFDPADIPMRFSLREPRNTFQYTADINPAVVSMRVKREIISLQQVTALFYSNKAIESLVLEDLGNAYAYARAALLEDPRSALAWNNLGVLYSRVGQTGLAIESYRTAVSVDADAQSAKSNLARTYRANNQIQLAEALEREVATYRERNPYYHASLAEQALIDGELDRALALYQDALDRKHNEQHFYHKLAIIFQALGNDEEMLVNLREARRYARGEEKARFANKLRALEDLL